MGREKFQMKIIEDKNARIQAFEKRKKALEKKAQELSTLCDVKICMVVFGPDQDRPMIWPENRDEVGNLIKSCQSKLSHECREYNLAAFFKDQTKKIEEETNKLKRKNRDDAKWDESLSFEETNEAVALLNRKIDVVKARINMIKEGSKRGINLISPKEEGGFVTNRDGIASNDGFVKRPLGDDIQALNLENERRMMLMNNRNFLEKFNDGIFHQNYMMPMNIENFHETYGMQMNNNENFHETYGMQMNNGVSHENYYDTNYNYPYGILESSMVQDGSLDTNVQPVVYNCMMDMPNYQDPLNVTQASCPMSFNEQGLFLSNGFPQVQVPYTETYQQDMMLGYGELKFDEGRSGMSNKFV